MTLFISFLTIIAQILVVILLWVYITDERRIAGFVEKYAALLAFLAGLSAILGSLYFSNVLNYIPCSLCWYQRYFMFPAVLILGIAAWKNYYVKNIVMALTAFGGAIAIYQNYGLIFNLSELPCSAAAVSCAKIYFVDFGYINIPIMALTAWFLIGALMLFQKKV